MTCFRLRRIWVLKSAYSRSAFECLTIEGCLFLNITVEHFSSVIDTTWRPSIHELRAPQHLQLSGVVARSSLAPKRRSDPGRLLGHRTIFPEERPSPGISQGSCNGRCNQLSIRYGIHLRLWSVRRLSSPALEIRFTAPNSACFRFFFDASDHSPSVGSNSSRKDQLRP